MRVRMTNNLSSMLLSHTLSLCRKHNCPKPSRPKTELFPNATGTHLGDTEYKTIYLEHANATPRENFKPPMAVIKRDSPMSNYTTNRVDYVPHPVTPMAARPPAVYKKPDGNVSGESEYNREYQYKVPELVKPIVPQSSQVRLTDKFLGKSTQAADFTPYQVQPRVVYGENRPYKPPIEKFKGTSTFQADFLGKATDQPVSTMKPSQETQLSKEPFNGASCYNADFKRFQLPEKVQRPKQAYRPPDEKFHGISSFTADFPGYRGVSPAQSYKPPMIAKASHEPIDGNTINRVSYQKWDLPARFSRPPTSYEPPTEKFASNTVFTDDFVSHGLPEPVQNYKPKHEPIKIMAPFENLTINRYDFRPVDLSQRTPLVVKENKYVPPVEKFDGKSTTSASYQGQFSLPAPSFKPQLKPYSKGVKFEGYSTYKQSYISPGIKPDCVTGGSPSRPDIPGYKFSYEDPRSGHKFYTPAATPSFPAAQQTREIPAC